MAKLIMTQEGYDKKMEEFNRLKQKLKQTSRNKIEAAYDGSGDTWPEYNYIAIDVFTCGNSIDPVKTCEIIAKNICSSCFEIKYYERGDKNAISRIRN